MDRPRCICGLTMSYVYERNGKAFYACVDCNHPETKQRKEQNEMARLRVLTFGALGSNAACLSNRR